MNIIIFKYLKGCFVEKDLFCIVKRDGVIGENIRKYFSLV